VLIFCSVVEQSGTIAHFTATKVQQLVGLYKNLYNNIRFLHKNFTIQNICSTFAGSKKEKEKTINKNIYLLCQK
jgi:hypothetical protein